MNREQMMRFTDPDINRKEDNSAVVITFFTYLTSPSPGNTAPHTYYSFFKTELLRNSFECPTPCACYPTTCVLLRYQPAPTWNLLWSSYTLFLLLFLLQSSTCLSFKGRSHVMDQALSDMMHSSRPSKEPGLVLKFF